MPSQTEMKKPTPTPTPVAWMGWFPGAGSVNSHYELTRHEGTMKQWGWGVEVTPLYTIEALEEMGVQSMPIPKAVSSADGAILPTTSMMLKVGDSLQIVTVEVAALEKEYRALQKENAELKSKCNALESDITYRTTYSDRCWFQEVLTDVDEKYGIIRGSKEGCEAIRADLTKLKQIFTLQQSLFGAVIRSDADRKEESHD